MISVYFHLVPRKRGDREDTALKLSGLWEWSVHINLELLPIASLTSLSSHFKGRALVFSLSASPPLFLPPVLYSFLKYPVGGLSLSRTQESFPIFHSKVPSLPNSNQVSLLVPPLCFLWLHQGNDGFVTVMK